MSGTPTSHNRASLIGAQPHATGVPLQRVVGPMLVVLLAFQFAPSYVVAQANGEGERRSMRAHRMEGEEGIQLDGQLVEPVWKRAVPASGFVQRDPIEGAEPSEPTEVYVVYTDSDLYIGAVLYDSEPDGILAFQKERDASLFTDDRFMWILDTFFDGRTGYFFEINPAGLRGDGIIGSGGGGFGGGGGGGGGGFGVNKSWDGIWDARVARQADGWSAEIRIPFRTLNFDPNRDTWGINFQRTIRRKNEESLWTGYRQNQQLTRPVHAGSLTGLEGMSQGMGLDVTPYVVTGWRNAPANDPTITVDETDFPIDAGVDLSYNVTPSLRAAVTVNTDFAEVEVDQRRVNLTRFPLRFPERRDFFLEGSGVFSFAPRNGVTPFFSRNVGLAKGEAVPIRYGARLGGQTGRYELGFLQVHTGAHTAVSSDLSDTTLTPSEDFTAARVKRTLFSQSSVGIVYTRRASSEDSLGFSPPDRHTVGWDLDLYTSSFLGDKNFQFEAFFVHNTKNEAGESSSFWDRTARGVRINFPNDVWRIHTSYRELGDDFDPAVGFTQRNGFRRLQPSVVFAPRPRAFLGIRQLEFEVRYEHVMDIDWRLETRKTDFQPLGIRFDSGDFMQFQVTQLFERLEADDAEDLSENLEADVSAGRYNMWQWQLMARTAGRRIVSGNAEIGGGEFWTGTRNRLELGVTFRPYPGVSLEADFETNRVSLEGAESFTRNLYRLETGWQFSPSASFTSNLQYDDQSQLLGLFARFRWIITPGSDLYLVHSYNWQNRNVDDPNAEFDFVTISRGLNSKLNYTHRF